ncbi:KCNH6, partial [Symbiodinium necroappetens]
GRVLGATFAGLAPLAASSSRRALLHSIEQPASAYDSVVAMLQSWLVGGISLVLIYGAALVAAVANPLTKRWSPSDKGRHRRTRLASFLAVWMLESWSLQLQLQRARKSRRAGLWKSLAMRNEAEKEARARARFLAQAPEAAKPGKSSETHRVAQVLSSLQGDMAHRSFLPSLLLLALGSFLLARASLSFVSGPARAGATPVEVDARVLGATFAGLAPLAVEQPANAYDSVVAMLQSWLVGGISLVLIYGAALVAAVANPLTKRRLEVRNEALCGGYEVISFQECSTKHVCLAKIEEHAGFVASQLFCNLSDMWSPKTVGGSLLVAVAVGCALLVSQAFVCGPARAAPEVDARVLAATFAGLSPLAVEQPAGAYDSVVAMLQSWLVGGISLVLIYGAALVAAVANPLTKRRLEVRDQVERK